MRELMSSLATLAALAGATLLARLHPWVALAVGGVLVAAAVLTLLRWLWNTTQPAQRIEPERICTYLPGRAS